MESAQVRIYHAAWLDDAEARLKLTKSRVLLTDIAYKKGNWTDAMQLVVRLHPPTVLVVAAQLADERSWIEVLERGAYDLIQKPFERTNCAAFWRMPTVTQPQVDRCT